TRLRSAGEGGRAGSRTLLAAKGAGAAIAQSRQDADADCQRRSVVPCALRALHGEISRTSGRASDVDRSWQSGRARQWPHDDAREKQSRSGGGHREMGGEGATGGDRGALKPSAMPPIWGASSSVPVMPEKFRSPA